MCQPRSNLPASQRRTIGFIPGTRPTVLAVPQWNHKPLPRRPLHLSEGLARRSVWPLPCIGSGSNSTKLRLLKPAVSCQSRLTFRPDMNPRLAILPQLLVPSRLLSRLLRLPEHQGLNFRWVPLHLATNSQQQRSLPTVRLLGPRSMKPSRRSLLLSNRPSGSLSPPSSSVRTGSWLMSQVFATLKTNMDRVQKSAQREQDESR